MVWHPYIANHVELLVSFSPIMVMGKKWIFLFTRHNVQCVSYEKVLYMSQHPTPTLPIFINQNWSSSKCIDLKAFPKIWKRRYKPSYTINNITNFYVSHHVFGMGLKGHRLYCLNWTKLGSDLLGPIAF